MFKDILVTESFEPLHDYELSGKFSPCDSCTEWARKCAELEARLEEIQKDAQRYRWLRTNAIDCQETGGINILRSIKSERNKNYAEIDAAIDSAMKEQRAWVRNCFVYVNPIPIHI